MVKHFIIALILVNGCVRTKKMVSVKNYSEKLKLQNLYIQKGFYYEWENFNGDLRIKDSVMYYSGYKFFRNGVIRKVSFDSSKTIEAINRDFKYDRVRTGWGTYEIKSDTIVIQEWTSRADLPVMILIGKIENDSTFILIKTKCIDCGKFDPNSNWRDMNVIYRYSKFDTAIDSVSKFIKEID